MFCSKRSRLPCRLFRNIRLRRLRSKHAAHFLSDLSSPFSPSSKHAPCDCARGSPPGPGLESNILWRRQSWLSRVSDGRRPRQSFQKRRKRRKHAVFEKWRGIVVLSFGTPNSGRRNQQSKIVLFLHSPNKTESGGADVRSSRASK